MIDLIPNLDRMSAIFSNAAAPAFLLAGVGAFVSVVLTRLGGIVDRMRVIKFAEPDKPRASEHKAELPLLKRRAALLQSAAFMGLLAGIVTTLLLMAMVANGYFGLRHAFGAPLLFFSASTLLSVSLFRFAQEVRMALGEIRDF